MRAFTNVDAVLGPKQSLTPEGFLVCEDVPLARTGTQIYLPHEIGMDAGPDGLVHVERRPEDVFTDKALASFQGKPVTDNHPPANLTPATWKDHGHGVIMNPRRGSGTHDGLMVADLIIHSADAIAAIRTGKRQVSCGYTAEYEVVGPGRARQHDIIGNHVALVDQGRCGGRCEIGDQDIMANDQVIPAATRIGKVTLKDRLAEVLATHDAETGGSEHHVHVHVGGTQDAPKPAAPGAVNDTAAIVAAAMKPVTDAMTAITTRLDKLEATKTGDEKKDDDDKKDDEKKSDMKKDDDDDKKEKGTKDSAPVLLTADAVPAAMQDLRSRAEVLIPGIVLPTMDAKADLKVVSDSLCMQKRMILTTALMMPKSAEIVRPLVAAHTKDVASMTCDAIATLFVAASDVAKAKNNAGLHGGLHLGAPGTRKVGDREFSGPVTPAEINLRNRVFNDAGRGA